MKDEQSSKYHIMAPLKGTKRKPDENVSSDDNGSSEAQNVAVYEGDADARRTPDQENPRKKQKTGIPLAQKQALIENLQLESTCPF